ncbi:MAG: UDP-N-acetylglucosamine--N-acetylmuramyl-(pentapeptide) pyrophosphoryl-undecaprenol N-acetylglucosamine transferase [Candidatus Uhrbacteria bacterium]
MEKLLINQPNAGHKITTIFFCGGGTLGPVTPLLALAEAWQKKIPEAKLFFVGTPDGPERILVAKAGLTFIALPKAKLPRYWSSEWLTFPWVFLKAFLKAGSLLLRANRKQTLIVSAGGYTAVPMILAGWFLGVRSWLHQQDRPLLLSNKVTAPFVSLITVAWPESLKDFPTTKTKLIGNPIRSAFLSADREAAIEYFSLNKNKPTVLVVGGGTGSQWLNERLVEIGKDLVEEANIIHLTGKNKMIEELKNFEVDYHAFELLNEEMPLALAAADLVVCRAGMGTITELAATHKPAIVVPLPNSPQEDNAEILEKNQAAIIVDQTKTTAENLFFIIRFLLADEARRRLMGEAMAGVLRTDVAEEMVEMGQGVLSSSSLRGTRPSTCPP